MTIEEKKCQFSCFIFFPLDPNFVMIDIFLLNSIFFISVFLSPPQAHVEKATTPTCVSVWSVPAAKTAARQLTNHVVCLGTAISATPTCPTQWLDTPGILVWPSGEEGDAVFE